MDLMQDIQIYKDLHVRLARVQKGCLYARDRKDPVKVQRPGVHCSVTSMSISGCPRVCAARMLSLCWKPGDDVKVEGEDCSAPKKQKSTFPSSFPFYSIQATSLLVGATHT